MIILPQLVPLFRPEIIFSGLGITMPVARKSKGKPRYTKPKRFRRRRGGATTNVNRSLQPIPDRYICKMKYAETVQTSASGQYQYRLNSLFDPNFSGGGHQAYGFDNLALLYNRYRVIATGWRIQQPQAYNGVSITTAAMPSNDVGIITFTDFGTMAENPRTKYVTNNPGGPLVTLSGKSYLPRLMGRTKPQYMADDNYQANVLSNPAETALLYISTFATSTGQGAAANLNVILEFTVEWFDLKHIAQS